MYFYTICHSIGPKERSRQALYRLPLISNFLTNFWMEHFDGARFSPNSVQNGVWHALNEPVCQYLRTRNPRCSTVYIDNSLGPLARDSPCILAMQTQTNRILPEPHKSCPLSKKVKCTLLQTLTHCTGHMAHRESRGIALLFLDQGTRKR